MTKGIECGRKFLYREIGWQYKWKSVILVYLSLYTTYTINYLLICKLTVSLDHQYYIGIAPGYVVDVTRRYAPGSTPPVPLASHILLPSQDQVTPNSRNGNRNGNSNGNRNGNSNGNGNSDVLELLDREDAVLSVLAHQKLPTSLAGYEFYSICFTFIYCIFKFIFLIPTLHRFKNHPTYVLEQHLHKFEAIPPSTPIIGNFKGNKVYHRSYRI